MPLAILNEAERRTLDTYVALLLERLGDNLVSVRAFGSVARGEQWWTGMPIRSDLDLLVLVREPVDAALQQELLDATYPLFLESGRQLGPQFRTPGTARRIADPRGHRAGRRRAAAPVNRWPGIDAAARSRQWPRIVDLAERVEAAPHLAGLVLLGSFARGEADPLSDVDFTVLVEPGRFDVAWAARHDLHPDDVACWDYPRPDEREVAAHRWLTSDLVLFDGLLSTTSGARIRDPFVLLVGNPSFVEEMNRFEPTSRGAPDIEFHEVEKLYGQLKLAARAARGE